MKKSTFLFFGSLLLAFLISSCSDSKFKGFARAENGLHYKFFKRHKDSTKVQLGDGITFYYLITNQKNDSIIVDSRKVSQDGSGYTKFLISKSSFVGSLEDGMLMMNKGDSAAFIIPADSFFLKTMGQNELPKGIAKGDFLKAVIRIKDVVTKAQIENNQRKQMADQQAMVQAMQAEEMPKLEKFIADNKITVKPTESGLYFIELKKGTGASPKLTDIIKFNYTGKFLDGTVFDSNEGKGGPVEYPLVQLIKGWQEAIVTMKKGGKARLIIPSSLGYGQGGGPMPPYATLDFEIELVDFKSAN